MEQVDFPRTVVFPDHVCHLEDPIANLHTHIVTLWLLSEKGPYPSIPLRGDKKYISSILHNTGKSGQLQTDLTL